MKKIAILVPKGAVMPEAVMGAYFLFSEVNKHLQACGQARAFETKIVGFEKKTLLYDHIFFVETHGHFEEMSGFDLIIVPGFTGEMEQALSKNHALITWMRQQYLTQNTELASMCSGAFLIAATGLANGKKCTTHWAFATAFQQYFPKVNLQPEHIVTDDQGIYTSGGAYSSLNLILYLVEKFCSREVALWASKIFQIDLNRTSQNYFTIFNQQKTHSDQPISKVQEYIEKHFREPLSIQFLASNFAFSRRNFIRRFKEATDNTPLEYIQRVRIESAKRLLETTRKSISEIMYESGYGDSKTFRSIFKKHTSLLPSEYRRRYAK